MLPVCFIQGNAALPNLRAIVHLFSEPVLKLKQQQQEVNVGKTYMLIQSAQCEDRECWRVSP